jgi:hypothetical protein
VTVRTRLGRGDQVPHFRAQTIDGSTCHYAAIWQHRNLLLVLLPDTGGGDEYVTDLRHRSADLERFETECVISRDAPSGMHTPGVLLADRWGEVVHIAASTDASGLPPVDELLDWLEYIQHRCPECEGEAR